MKIFPIFIKSDKLSRFVIEIYSCTALLSFVNPVEHSFIVNASFIKNYVIKNYELSIAFLRRL